MEELSALCANLGDGSSKKVKGGEPVRVPMVLDILGRRAEEVRPSVLFTQDTFALTHLKKLREILDNNILDSKFSLDYVNIGGSRYVSIFVDTAKFEVQLVDKESNSALQLFRRSKASFLEEKRYVVVKATSKQSKGVFLLGSFHGKHNGAKKEVREELIEDFFKFLEELAKRVGAKNILIGTDINHVMESFKPSQAFCVSALNCDYPNLCPDSCEKRKSPVIDYFLHSPELQPMDQRRHKFHEDTAVMDHHPIHAVFNVATGSKVEQKQKAAPSPVQVAGDQQPAVPARKGRKNNSEEERTAARTQRASSKTKPDASQAGSRASPIHASNRAFSTNASQETYTQKANGMLATVSEGKPSAASTSNERGATEKRTLAANHKSQTKPEESLTAVSNEVEKSFLCNLCGKAFSTSRGLSIHVGKSKDHFPCRQKTKLGTSDDLTCNKVFHSEALLMHHKASHGSV